MAIQRVRCEWGGAGVEGPGVTTFYGEADGTLSIAVAASAFFARLTGLIPTGTTVTIPQGGDLIDEVTGQLVGTWGGSIRDVKTCTGSGAFAGGVGARVVWETGAIRAGRRVRGSTFVVPIVTTSYEANGTLSQSALTSIQNALTDFMVQVPTQARVWSRPRPGLGGAAVQVERGVAPDKVSWLRSRRV